MKTEEEILQAISDLGPCMTDGNPAAKLAVITIDTLMWVLDLPSTCDAGLASLRQIRKRQDGAVQ